MNIGRALARNVSPVIASRRYLTVIVMAIASMAAASMVQAHPADPYSLEEVNVSKRVMATLSPPIGSSEEEKSALLSARESIARSVLLLNYETLSMERLRSILKWSSPTDPLFAPGISPAAGSGQRPPYIFGRTQNWRLQADGTIMIEVVWTPFLQTTLNHFIETQWYRRDGANWYLYKQDRREIKGCDKWPTCLGNRA
jgi:hypothetical protein